MLLLIDLKGGENTKSKRLFIISIILVFSCLNVVSATGDIGDNTLGDATVFHKIYSQQQTETF